MSYYSDYLNAVHECDDIGYDLLTDDEKVFLGSNGVPLSRVDNNFRRKGEIAVNSVVKRMQVLSKDYDEVITLGVAAENLKLIYADMDTTQFDIAEAFFF